MAQVPYSAVPNVAPGATADPQIRVETPPAAFGVDTAKAIRGLGEMETRMAGEYEATATQMQSRTNDITAKQMYVDTSAQIGGLESTFYERKGQDAANARPQYEQDLKDVYTNAINNAPNQQVRQQLSDALSRRISYSIIDGERHAGQQQAIANKDLSNALVADALANVVKDPFNAAKRETLFGTIDTQVTARAKMEGKDDISAKLDVDKVKSIAWRSIFEQMAFNQPWAAQQLFEKHRGEIGGINDRGEPYTLEIERNIQTQMNRKGSSDFVRKLLYGGDYLQRLDIQEGRDKAKTSTAVGFGQLTDAAWADVRKGHPELNLPEKHSKATDEENYAATVARTADNQAGLEQAGITANMANTYLAHFLGLGGAKRFLTGFEQNPNQPVSNLVSPEAMAANRNVFFNRDGTMRTAQQVYDRQTANFQGPGQLTAKSGAADLQTYLDAAHRWADANQPNNPEFWTLTEQRIISEYNRVHQVARLESRENFTSLFSSVIGGDGGARITNMDEIFKDPAKAQLYDRLQSDDPAKAEQIRRAVENNMKTGSLPPEQQTAMFNKIMGLGLRAETDPAARDEFEKLPMGDLNGQLSQSLIKQLDEAQRHVQKVWQGKADALERNNRLNGALAFLRPTLNAAGIRPAPAGDTSEAGKRQTEAYDTFVGSLYSKLTEVERVTGKPVTDQAQIMGLAAPLMQQLPDPRGPWNFGRLFQGNPAGRTFQLPEKVSQQITQDFVNDPRNTAKRPPTPFELGVAYQKALVNPELRTKYGIQ